MRIGPATPLRASGAAPRPAVEAASRAEASSPAGLGDRLGGVASGGAGVFQGVGAFA